MTRHRSALPCAVFVILVVLMSCQSARQNASAPSEGNIRVVRLAIVDWENDGTGARVRSTLSGFKGVLSISETPRIGQVTVSYDQSKVTFEQMEKALNDKGVSVTQRIWLE